MLSDPMTVATSTFAFNSSWPAASESAIQGQMFNGIELGPGAKSRKALAPSALSTLSLSKAEVSISHTTTNNGRVRSMFRVDIAKNDAQLVPHTAAFYVVLDKEATLTSEGTAALQKAIATLFLFLNNGTGANALTTSSTMSEFLNGEV